MKEWYKGSVSLQYVAQILTGVHWVLGGFLTNELFRLRNIIVFQP